MLLNSPLGVDSPPSENSSTKACRDLVEHLLASGLFRKSLRQRQLLVYLTDRALEAPGCEIHEHEIGEAVFERAPGYDTSADNIVRVNIYDLRKRLHSYFNGEGKDKAIRIEIPKGSYCPVFVPRHQAPDHWIEKELRRSTPESRRFRSYLFPAAILLLVLICGGLLIRNTQLNRELSAGTPSSLLKLLWSRMVDDRRQTDVVLADSNLSFAQDLQGRSLDAGAYFRGEYLSHFGPLSAQERQVLELSFSRRYTSIADVRVLQRIMLVNGRNADRMNVHFARDFSPDDLKTSNVVLLGSSRSNPWVQFFAGSMNFGFQHDNAAKFGSIINNHPMPGEQKVYATVPISSMVDSYGVIAFLPNLAGTGNVLILAGAGMHATESAGEIVTRDKLWADVVRVLGLKSSDSLPYFEVLLKTRVMGATMQRPQIIAWRRHPAH